MQPALFQLCDCGLGKGCTIVRLDPTKVSVDQVRPTMDSLSF